MKINLIYEKEINVGDVIHAVGGSGTYYMVVQTVSKKYVLLDLKESTISSEGYDNITDMIEKFFGIVEIKVISNNNLQLTMGYY